MNVCSGVTVSWTAMGQNLSPGAETPVFDQNVTELR